MVLLWDTPTPGNPERSLNAHQGSIATVGFSPDEQKLASAGEEGTVALWDTSKPGKPSRVLKGHQGSVLGLAFSPTGTQSPPPAPMGRCRDGTREVPPSP